MNNINGLCYSIGLIFEKGGGVGAYIRDVNWVLYLGMPIFGREGAYIRGIFTGYIRGAY